MRSVCAVCGVWCAVQAAIVCCIPREVYLTVFFVIRRDLEFDMHDIMRLVLWKYRRVHPGDVRNHPQCFSSYRGLIGDRVVHILGRVR